MTGERCARNALEQLHAEQREDLILDADLALEQFLDSCTPATVLADLTPTTGVERRHLARARKAHTA